MLSSNRDCQLFNPPLHADAYLNAHLWSISGPSTTLGSLRLFVSHLHIDQPLWHCTLSSRKRGPTKLTAVIKIKHQARPKPSYETTHMEMIHCCFINFKRGGGQRSIICVFACLCSRLPPPRALERVRREGINATAKLRTFAWRGEPRGILQGYLSAWYISDPSGDGEEMDRKNIDWLSVRGEITKLHRKPTTLNSSQSEPEKERLDSRLFWGIHQACFYFLLYSK